MEEEKFKEAGVADLFLKEFQKHAEVRMRKAETIQRFGPLRCLQIGSSQGFSHTMPDTTGFLFGESLTSLMMRQRFTNPSLKQLPMRTIRRLPLYNQLCRKYIDKLYDKSLAEQMVSMDTEDLKSDSRWPQRIRWASKYEQARPDTIVKDIRRSAYCGWLAAALLRFNETVRRCLGDQLNLKQFAEHGC